ncbi:MAG: YqhA family protein, partial [Campylobacterales bacterium]|nr:YqhA family protein [Campylobacterales bacterium]
AVVLLIFSFGLYELFISDIDEAKNSSSSSILSIQSLDQLKDKIAKVIVMVLVVSFFQRVLHMEFATPLEMLYFAGSILILSLGLYFLNKKGKS